MYRYLTGHPWLLPVAVALVLVGGVGGAFAAYPENSVTQYTGCLNTGGAAGGSFSGVAVGDSPAKACGPNQIVAHLSGGDITAVRTPPGSGLSGGTENGAATLSLASGFSLPQSCSDAQIPVWSGTNTAWACGSDNDTTYSNGTGLDLSSGNAFSVSPPYRLPQNCASGQAPQSTGNNTWTCGSSVNGVGTFVVSKDFSIGTEDFADNTLDCPAGSVPTGGGFWAGSLQILQSSPSLDTGTFGGWRVVASSGLFDNDHYTIYVVCLKTT